LRRADRPMTARDIADVLIAGKQPEPTRKQAIKLQVAILAALWKRDGGTVVGERAPARWKLKEAASVGGPSGSSRSIVRQISDDDALCSKRNRSTH
jgi:hypothetical protein